MFDQIRERGKAGAIEILVPDVAAIQNFILTSFQWSNVCKVCIPGGGRCQAKTIVYGCKKGRTS